MEIQVIVFSDNQDTINVNGTLLPLTEIGCNDNKCYVYFHTGNHHFNFWWSKSNDLQTDILYVKKIECKCKINVNFIDLSKILDSMLEFSNRYKSLNLNVFSAVEALYHEILFKLSEMRVD